MISKNIATSALQTTSIQYFSPDMALKANDLVVEFSNKLPLTDKFRIHPGFIHTSSDGQKYDVSVASLRAAWSFKYFGNGKGVTIYSHLDEAGQLFYSTTFSSSDHEAPYMIDGLMHNRVIQSDAHSTDTGGYVRPARSIKQCGKIPLPLPNGVFLPKRAGPATVPCEAFGTM